MGYITYLAIGLTCIIITDVSSGMSNRNGRDHRRDIPEEEMNTGILKRMVGIDEKGVTFSWPFVWRIIYRVATLVALCFTASQAIIKQYPANTHASDVGQVTNAVNSFISNAQENFTALQIRIAGMEGKLNKHDVTLEEIRQNNEAERRTLTQIQIDVGILSGRRHQEKDVGLSLGTNSVAQLNP